MTRARIINAAIWVAIIITLYITVVMEWKEQGCEAKSLILAAIFYTLIPLGIGGVIDATIQGK